MRAMRPMLYKASSVASLDANKRNPGRNSLCHFLLFHYSSEWPLLPVPQAWVWLPKVVLIKHTANQLNDNSGARIRWAANNLEKLRRQCSDSLNALGKEKVIILDGSVQRFLDAFQQLKNVDFTASEGLDELNKLRIDKAAFAELKTMGNIASSLLEGGVTGGGQRCIGCVWCI